MTDHIVKLADDFWNVRGSLKIAGLLDVGTQCSLVRRKSGGYVLLDSYTLSGEVAEEILARTSGGKDIEAVINLHPFHTIHVEAVAAQLPHAKLYGTERHVRRASHLKWESTTSNDPELGALFEGDLEFTVPAGVDFIPKNQNLHFASVLAYHPSSRVLHSDDTLSNNPLPLIGGLAFHPSFGQVLQKRPGAAAEFRAWAAQLIERCANVEHLCTAHARALTAPASKGGSFAGRVRSAYQRLEKKLNKHEAKYG